MITQKDPIFKLLLEVLTLYEDLKVIAQYNEQHTIVELRINFPHIQINGSQICEVISLFDKDIKDKISEVIMFVLEKRLSELPSHYMEIGDEIELAKIQSEIDTIEACNTLNRKLSLSEELRLELNKVFN